MIPSAAGVDLPIDRGQLVARSLEYTPSGTRYPVFGDKDWYTTVSTHLHTEIRTYCHASSTYPFQETNPVALIVPHAAPRFSGPVASNAYTAPTWETIKYVFMLGPHHAALSTDKALLTGYRSWRSPVRDFPVATEIITQIANNFPDTFSIGQPDQELNEHSLEIQLPFLSYVYPGVKNPKPRIVPILLSRLTLCGVEKVAEALQPYFAETGVLFLISSDFTHWGSHHNFTDGKETGDPNKFIERLDKSAMKAIQDGEFEEFYKTRRHTICGASAIRVVHKMWLARERKDKEGKPLDWYWLDYARSHTIYEPLRDNAVSYAAAALVPPRPKGEPHANYVPVLLDE